MACGNDHCHAGVGWCTAKRGMVRPVRMVVVAALEHMVAGHMVLVLVCRWVLVLEVRP